MKTTILHCLNSVLNVSLDAREPSSCTSNHWAPALSNLKFHKSTPWGGGSTTTSDFPL